MPKVAKVKNKAPAEIQITAEQLLREAKERDLEILPPPPKQKISDPEELREYQHRKRKAFEDNIRKNRLVIGNWLKYAQWEESQKQVQRARSIYERALDVDHRNVTLWLKYTEMEMRNRQVNHARNLWDRAVTILPRVSQFWYKYTYMEEMLENVAGARQVFERWMEWQPDEQAWQTYINFELRYKELDRARQIYERFVMVHPDVKHWIKYAKFEENHGFINSARKIFERAVEFFGDEELDERLFIAFAKFEENQKEHDRARVIYKYALDHIPKDRNKELYKAYTIHEKKYGDRSGIEDVIKFLEYGPENCVTWIKFAELETLLGDIDRARAIYEIAVGQPRLDMPELLWKSYIDFEVAQSETDKARQLYERLLERTVHVKVWLSYAKFELNAENPDNINTELARRVYERANESLKSAGEKESRVLLLEAWKEFETEIDDKEKLEKVLAKMPRRVKKRQKIISEAGIEEGWEEVFDYIFPEDEMVRPNLKLLAAAKNWRKKQVVPDNSETESNDEQDKNSGDTQEEDPSKESANEES
ncbi:crooked neck like protein [Danaus plexippus plexippus]|uniref:Crooked neck like protein n=1 Tax=Danaus plexippus plexippus TaxID=278856 RepID=A0A212EW57_DANPL|nr:crooked neck like protein [Danaus plexippus plexippus]